MLRVSEEKSFYRVGGSKNLHVDVRIVAATNRDLQEAVESGDFREDLYYRLNVAALYIPPLRDRRDDILPLAKQSLQEFSGSFGKTMTQIDDEVKELLLACDWKGNVRELRNSLERAVLLEEGDTLQADHLAFLRPARQASSQSKPKRSMAFSLPPDGVVLDDLNRDLIEQALAMTNGNQVQAARLLGLTRGTLRYRLDKYGIRSAD